MIANDYLQRAAEVVRQGGVLIYPTETVYGMGGDATQKTVLDRVRNIKGRDGQKPMLILTDTWERVETWISEVGPLHRKLMWHDPALPVTILFKPSAIVPGYLHLPSPYLAIRKTTYPFCTRLIAAADCPILSTSANLSGFPAVNDPANLSDALVDDVDYLVAASEPLSGTPSTVLSVQDGQFQIHRAGAVNEKALTRIISQSAV